MRIQNKFFSDLIWNYISTAVTAICGASFSIIVSLFYPERVLGRFNTIYSCYIVLSQLCVCGLHMAVTKYTAEHLNEDEEIYGILCESLILVVAISTSVSVLGYLIVNWGLYFVLGDSWLRSFNTIWFALILFSINKVFLGWLNGRSMMKVYAFFQCMRNVLIALSLCVFALAKLSGDVLTYGFLLAESIIFLGEIIYLLHMNSFRNRLERKHFSEILKFGIKILPSNAVMELNTKIDVICMAFILSNESVVGVYSFAVMFAEGFFQLFVVIRKILNPTITVKYATGKIKEFIETIRKHYLKYLYLFGCITWILLCIGFLIIISVIGNREYIQGLLPLIIISVFIFLNAKSLIYGNLLAQTGNPAEESIINVITTTFNGLANIILISRFGMVGAAMATGLSYCIYNLLQKVFVWKRLKLLL